MSESLMPFIEELTEARMYRYTSTLKGKTLDELAEVAYMMILLMELMRKEDPVRARRYAMHTTFYDNVEYIRQGSSDLHNLLSIIKNQTEHVDRITPNPDITLPMLTTKKYFRDIESNTYRRGEVRPYIQRLERFFKIRSGEVKEIRRIVLYWDLASEQQKAATKKRIRNYFQKHSFNNDLYTGYKTKL
jgi:hypothetical protein